MKRLISCFLAVFLLQSLWLPAYAAESATATTLRLERTEGTVALKNQNGKAVTAKDEMKLYSGYQISTRAASYAYVSLDENKVLKLDAASSATIKKKGKKLEILLESGKIFFNVKVPLAADETLEVRTSTMVTGIRGTSAVIGSDGTVYLLDGHIVLSSMDPSTGQIREITLQPGQLARTTPVTSPDGTPGTQVDIQPFGAQDVAPFAALAVGEDPALQDKIAQQSGLDIKDMLEKAPAALEKEQQEQKQAEKDAVSAKEQQGTPKVDHVTPPTPTPGPGAGDDFTPTPPPVDPPPPELPAPSTTLVAPFTLANIKTALTEYKTVNLSSNGASTVIALGAGETLTIPQDNALALLDGVKMELDAQANLQVDGTVSLDASAALHVKNSSTNLLEIDEADTGLTIGTTGQLVLLPSSTLTLDPQSQLRNTGTLQISGTVINQGTLYNQNILKLTPSSRLENLGVVELSRPVAMDAGSKILFKSGYFLGEGARDLQYIYQSDGTTPIIPCSGTLTPLHSANSQLVRYLSSSWLDVIALTEYGATFAPGQDLTLKNLSTAEADAAATVQEILLGDSILEMGGFSLSIIDCNVAWQNGTITGTGTTIKLVGNSTLQISGGLIETRSQTGAALDFSQATNPTPLTIDMGAPSDLYPSGIVKAPAESALAISLPQGFDRVQSELGHWYLRPNTN